MDGFVLAGTKSGVGKTVATLAIVQALQDDGYTVQPAKAGPDFIDPSHHERVAGRPSRTLDLWLEGDDGVRRNYHRGDGDICVVEGVMGLYDGDCSSTAMVADALDVPVVLVVDAKAGMESVAATAHGFREYASHAGRDIDVAGIIAQRAHGGRHEDGIKEALPDGMAYFGRIPPRSNLEIPDRHLGLHMGEESPLEPDALSEAAETIRTDRLVDAAREPPRPAQREADKRTETGSRVAVASDAAFCFAYPATIERLRERAEVVTFSPIAGDNLPDCDGVYLPGGYPELHGSELEGSPTLDDIAARAADGLPVIGECGGLMALTESLTTDEGTYEMAGVLPADVQMCDRYQALDHVELRAKTDTLTASQGDRLRGHEFHYSSADVASDARFAFDVVRGSGIQDSSDGLTEYRTLGTYCHLHAESGAFDAFTANL
ncbi:cobyrinic acid a,c-diamide synthase [Halogeometricum borinquense DSM 11551]|uniref:Cobyrinate a,c-diamide synthase n=1 Tax=Halogeometricum borinquense (strain ATCC 700274 / DSM 11551 / JCM 10706 / KCTC 4070 / PR3) TaxID=469382 RepID=E4NKP5_HALBP|nr:cobyrinic acid a,c-diamide synthase [Halogeometricum borinquense]ADQ65941.1 hydrogenobyrinic acid a,c-diamide synthase (glutamine-hydrolysing); cobyrinate a,c-diamide synthase [Halogeometricum borinquense DSM 11551]ELY23097.1 cobyrinic acid a,c-diamide synthase [Halogeometricum borinquense DSM 11551]